MDEQKVKDLIQQIIDTNDTNNQFAVSQTPFHTHNGSDSSLLRFTILKDVPISYYQSGGSLVAVNTSENALIFLPVGAAGQVLTSNGTGALPTFQTSVSSFGGIVNTDGTASTPFPSGWSITYNAVGSYTITHNLGTTNYVVTGSIISGGKDLLVTGIVANSFDILTVNNSNTAVDSKFTFILLKT